MLFAPCNTIPELSALIHRAFRRRSEALTKGALGSAAEFMMCRAPWMPAGRLVPACSWEKREKIFSQGALQGSASKATVAYSEHAVTCHVLLFHCIQLTALDKGLFGKGDGVCPMVGCTCCSLLGLLGRKQGALGLRDGLGEEPGLGRSAST